MKLPVYRLPLLKPISGRDYFDYTRAHDLRFISDLLPLLKHPSSAFLIDFTPPVTVPTADGDILKRYFNVYTKRRLQALEDRMSHDDFVGLLQSIYADHFSACCTIRNPFGLLFHRAAQLMQPGANDPV